MVWKWFRTRFGPKSVHDPFFGRLLYMDGYWEGKRYFEPVEQEIEWFVEAGPEGPGASQHALVESVSSRYQELLPAILSVIHPYANEWARRQLGVSELESLLSLSAIDLPVKEGSEMTWALAFDSQLTGSPHFVVRMQGWKPIGEVDVSD